MKIALVCDWYRPRIGGIELHLENLAQRLGAAGHDVVVITPTPGEPVVDGVRVVRIDAPLAPHFGFLRSAAGIRAIGRALEREKVDVAHCHVSIVSPAAIGGAMEAERRGVASVLTFHSVVPQTRVLAHAMRVGLRTREWRACFTAVSRRVAEGGWRAAAGAGRMAVLPNGIDVAYWRGAARAPAAGRALRLVSVMRLNPKKRPLALVELMSRVTRALTSDVRLRVAGDGPKRGAMERAISRAGLSDRIELLGARTRDEVRDLLADSDVFVLPTIRESFGIAALEARAVGLPVVAMASSGVSELIAHGREGLLARSDAELAEHVVTLARDRAVRESIARHNREQVPAFDWPRVVDAHLAVYREAIALRESVRADR